MKRRRILTITFVLVACVLFFPWLDNPLNYVHWKDRVRTSLPVALVFGTACSTYENGYVMKDNSPNCYQYEPSREFKGVWIYQFEGSMFIEGIQQIPLQRPDYKSTAWLDYNPEQVVHRSDYDDYDNARECYPISAFTIRFVGRRRSGDGGHFGLFGADIVVDKMLAAKPLAPPDCRTYR